MRIAIIGSGISGLVCAHLLHPEHEITVFEADSKPGGHVNTVDVVEDGRRLAVDTGFIVFNEETYPAFVRLLTRLGVESQPSSMSFSVKDQRSGLEWASHGLSALLGGGANVLDAGFHRLVLEILRFNAESRALLESGDDDLTLGAYVEREGYSRRFVEQYLVPLGASVWSADPKAFGRFPARMFVRFFENHRFLQLTQTAPWRTVKGGSRSYVEALLAPMRDRLRLATPVERVRRGRAQVEVVPRGGAAERFDHVVLATHSDQALALLADPSDREREVLSALRYQANEAVLHTDERVLPARRACRAAWNYLVPQAPRGRVAVTYDMNVLQRLESRRTYLVSLNMEGEIDPARIIRRIPCAHPVFTPEALRAQRRHEELLSAQTSFCGAYWRYGFHEDGVQSALAVCRRFGLEG